MKTNAPLWHFCSIKNNLIQCTLGKITLDPWRIPPNNRNPKQGQTIPANLYGFLLSVLAKLHQTHVTLHLDPNSTLQASLKAQLEMAINGIRIPHAAESISPQKPTNRLQLPFLWQIFSHLSRFSSLATSSSSGKNTEEWSAPLSLLGFVCSQQLLQEEIPATMLFSVALEESGNSCQGVCIDCLRSICISICISRILFRICKCL